MSQNPSTDPQTYHRNLTSGDGDPETALIQTLAEIKGVDVSDLTQLYTCVNSMIADLLTTPPPAETVAELTFTYEGYRITVYQGGHAVLQRLDRE